MKPTGSGCNIIIIEDDDDDGDYDDCINIGTQN